MALDKTFSVFGPACCSYRLSPLRQSFLVHNPVVEITPFKAGEIKV